MFIYSICLFSVFVLLNIGLCLFLLVSSIFCFFSFSWLHLSKIIKNKNQINSKKVLLTICAILSLKLLQSSLLAIMNKSSIFSPVIADVSNENSIFRSRLNYSTFSILTSRWSAISSLFPTRKIMTSGSLYAITSLYHVDKLLKVSIRVISYAKKIQ